MYSDSLMRRWFALVCLVYPIFGIAYGLHAAEEDRSVCFDAMRIHRLGLLPAHKLLMHRKHPIRSD